MTLNQWFLSLELGRQKVLREDMWMLAEAAWQASRRAAMEEAAQFFNCTIGTMPASHVVTTLRRLKESDGASKDE